MGLASTFLIIFNLNLSGITDAKLLILLSGFFKILINCSFEYTISSFITPLESALNATVNLLALFIETSSINLSLLAV